MNTLLYMSTDADIVGVNLSPAWVGGQQTFSWPNFCHGGLNLPGGSTVITVAHGASDIIGNAVPGTVDINAAGFITLIQGNMMNNAAPGAVYISVCQQHHATFAAAVRNAADQTGIWPGIVIYGHEWQVAGPIPGPGQNNGWTAIY